MNTQLIVCAFLHRDSFLYEDFIPSDDMLILVKSGKFEFSSDSKNHTVGPLEGAYLRKNVLYHRRVLEPVDFYIFRFRSDCDVFPEDHVIFSDKERIASTIAMLDRSEEDLLNQNFRLREHLFKDIIFQYEYERGSFREDGLPSDPTVESAIAYINGHLHKKLSLSEIGSMSGLSYAQFLRRFKAYTGLTPAEYFGSARIQKAKELLSGTDLLIKDIAAMCGFDNEYYFSNHFKKQTGMSPTGYRLEKF